MQNIRIATKRLILRPLPPGYAPQVLDYYTRNREYFQPWLPRYDEDYFTLSYQKEKLRIHWERMEKGEELRLYAFHKTDSAFNYILGDVAYTNIIRGVLQGCFLGYKTDERAAGKGIATEAIEAGNLFAFNTLMLNRIEAHILPRNEASKRVIEKLDFELEGLAKRYLLIDGVWEDHLRYAKVKSY